MKKTTIELQEEQYFYLKEKALALQRQNKSATVVSLIRELIDKDRTGHRHSPVIKTRVTNDV